MKTKLFALSLLLFVGTAFADVDCTKNPDHPLCKSSSDTTVIDIKDEAPAADPEPSLLDEPATEEIAPSMDTSSDSDDSSSDSSTESDSF